MIMWCLGLGVSHQTLEGAELLKEAKGESGPVVTMGNCEPSHEHLIHDIMTTERIYLFLNEHVNCIA